MAKTKSFLICFSPSDLDADEGFADLEHGGPNRRDLAVLMRFSMLGLIQYLTFLWMPSPRWNERHARAGPP